MRATRTAGLGVAAATLALLTIGFLGGSARAATTSGCNSSGRSICITTTDEDAITHSTATITRYTTYTARVSNGGGSTLTNGNVTMTLEDVVPGAVEKTVTAKFVAAPTGCTSVSLTEFTCPLANLGAFAPGERIGPFFASTSTNTAATATRLVVTATFKEKASDHGAPDPQSDTFTWNEDTSLETGKDFSQSVAFLGGSTVLETFGGYRGQSSVFKVPVALGFAGSTLTTLTEFSSGESGYFCAAGFSCFGQSVATSALGIFSATNLANLVTTMDPALLPSGVGEKSLTVHHKVGAVTVSFTTACSGDLFTQPSASQVLPCRRVVIDKKAGTVIIDIWDNHQGDWGFS